MDERDEERVVVEETPPRVERETTVVTGGGGGGGGGAVIAVVLLLIVAVLLFLWLGGHLSDAVEETDINVNVEAPQLDVPDNIDVNLPPAEEPAEAPGNSG